MIEDSRTSDRLAPGATSDSMIGSTRWRRTLRAWRGVPVARVFAAADPVRRRVSGNVAPPKPPRGGGRHRSRCAPECPPILWGRYRGAPGTRPSPLDRRRGERSGPRSRRGRLASRGGRRTWPHAPRPRRQADGWPSPPKAERPRLGTAPGPRPRLPHSPVAFRDRSGRRGRNRPRGSETGADGGAPLSPDLRTRPPTVRPPEWVHALEGGLLAGFGRAGSGVPRSSPSCCPRRRIYPSRIFGPLKGRRRPAMTAEPSGQGPSGLPVQDLGKQVGAIRLDTVHIHVEQLFHSDRVVHGPHVHGEVACVRGSDQPRGRDLTGPPIGRGSVVRRRSASAIPGPASDAQPRTCEAVGRTLPTARCSPGPPAVPSRARPQPGRGLRPRDAQSLPPAERRRPAPSTPR